MSDASGLLFARFRSSAPSVTRSSDELLTLLLLLLLIPAAGAVCGLLGSEEGLATASDCDTSDRSELTLSDRSFCCCSSDESRTPPTCACGDDEDDAPPSDALIMAASAAPLVGLETEARLERAGELGRERLRVRSARRAGTGGGSFPAVEGARAVEVEEEVGVAGTTTVVGVGGGGTGGGPKEGGGNKPVVAATCDDDADVGEEECDACTRPPLSELRTGVAGKPEVGRTIFDPPSEAERGEVADASEIDTIGFPAGVMALPGGFGSGLLRLTI